MGGISPKTPPFVFMMLLVKYNFFEDSKYVDASSTFQSVLAFAGYLRKRGDRGGAEAVIG